MSYFQVENAMTLHALYIKSIESLLNYIKPSTSQIIVYALPCPLSTKTSADLPSSPLGCQSWIAWPSHGSHLDLRPCEHSSRARVVNTDKSASCK